MISVNQRKKRIWWQTFSLNTVVKVSKNVFRAIQMAGIAISPQFFLIRLLELLLIPKYAHVPISTKMIITPISAHNSPKIFECVRPFCGFGTQKVKFKFYFT